MIVQFIEYLRKRLQEVKYFFFGTVVAIAIWSLTVELHHAHTWTEQHIPFFWGIFGIISTVVIIFFSRWYGRGGIKTREDYYDN